MATGNPKVQTGFTLTHTSPVSNHEFKITKQQAGIYLTCCGDEIQYYTSTEFGLPNSFGWYITQANGDFNGDRFDTLLEVKTFLTRFHKVGA